MRKKEAVPIEELDGALEVTPKASKTISNRKLLDDIIAKENKKAGRPIIMRANDSRLVRGVLSTGNVALDEVLGGGLVKGLSVEIYGAAGAGKTSTCCTIIKEAQKDAPEAIQFYFGSESDAPLIYFENNDINTDNLFLIRPLTSAEESLDVILSSLRSLREVVNVNLIVIDSVAALAPQSEMNKSEEKGISSQDMAIQARLLSKLHRIISGGGYLADGAILVMTNQERMQLGQTPLPNTTPGGLANRFYCKTRFRLTCPKA
ncbi:MAG: hypothetical protein EOM67_13865, partial [Spirochaetia bacterium]|nr:hypothetical protein [Spirochaetia bacterium]